MRLSRSKHLFAATLMLCLSSPFGMPAFAQNEEAYPAAQDIEGVEALAGEGVRKLIQALGIIVQQVPQYELPVILDNGDILIRRIPKGLHRDTPLSESKQ